jgi:hypothetical protein
VKTRSGVAIAYCEFADVRLNFTTLVNSAFFMVPGDYLIHFDSPIILQPVSLFKLPRGIR